MDSWLDELTKRRLNRRARQLEWATMGWNVVGVAVLVVAALGASSVALAGFALDSVIEIGASGVVLWELADVQEKRRARAVQLIGVAFVLLGIYLAIQSTWVLAVGFVPRHSTLGILWTGATFLSMIALARGKSRVGHQLGNQVVIAESRVTMVDAVLAGAVMVGLALNALLGWWWADPLTGYVILYYALREARESFAHDQAP